MRDLTDIQKSFRRVFSAKMDSLYYAVKAINSGKVESDLSQLEKMLITLLSLPLDQIPVIGDTVKNGFQSFCKKALVDKPSKNFERNLNYPSADEFKVYTEIICALIERSTKVMPNCDKKIDTEKSTRKLSSLIVVEFFKFAANSIHNADSIGFEKEFGTMAEYKKEFILRSYAFLEHTSDRINSFFKRKKIPLSFEISPEVVLAHLDELDQIRTVEEKLEEKQAAQFKEFAERTCRMIASKLDGVSVKQCMSNVVSC